MSKKKLSLCIAAALSSAVLLGGISVQAEESAIAVTGVTAGNERNGEAGGDSSLNLNNETKEVVSQINLGGLTAENNSKVTVKNDGAVTIKGSASLTSGSQAIIYEGGSLTAGETHLTGSTISSAGTTNLDSLTGTDGSNLTVSGGTTTIEGTASLIGSSVNVNANGILTSGETTLNNSKVTVKKDGNATITGSASLTNGSQVTVDAGASLTAGETHLNGGTLTSSGSTTLDSLTSDGGNVAVSGGTTTIKGTASLTGSSVNVNANGSFTSGNTTLDGGNVTVRKDGNATITGSASLTNGSQVTVDAGGTLTAGDTNLNGGTLTSSGSITLGSLTGTNGSNVAVSSGTTTVNGTASLTNSNVHVYGGSLKAGDTTLTGSKLTSSGKTELGSLTADSASQVTVNAGASLTAGDTKLTGSSFASSGTTNLGSLSADAESTVSVNNGTLTVSGKTNTNHFYVDGGTVNLNGGGTLVGDEDTSALYINGAGTVNATGVTFTDGEVAVDNGGALNLTGGTVEGSFTAEGGTITTNGGTVINSGIWVHDSKNEAGETVKDGTATLTGSTVSGTVGAQDSSEITLNGSTVTGDILAQDHSAVTMNGGTLTAEDVALENGSTITFDQEAVVTTDTITAVGSDNTLAILDGANVTAGSLDTTNGNLIFTASSDSSETDGISFLDDTAANSINLTLTGNTTVDHENAVSYTGGFNVTLKGDSEENSASFTVNEGGSISVSDGASLTFDSNSHLYANSSSAVIQVTDASVAFEEGSSVHASATEGEDGTYTVNTIVSASGSSTVDVDENASIFVHITDVNGTYVFDNVITGDSGTSGWAGNTYGDSKLEVIGDNGTVTYHQIKDTYKGISASAVYDEALLVGQVNGANAASDFVDNVVMNRGDEAQDDLRIANALNSHTGMTGLAGVGYGTYRFTNAFTDMTANHEEGDLWASYLHDKSSVDGLSVGSVSADYDLTFDGAVVGSDFYRKGNTTIGAAFAYADGSISTNSGVSTKNDVDYYGGMIYGSVKGAAGMTYRAEIGYNRSSNDITQTNTGTAITGSVDADAFHAGVSAEKEIVTGAGTLTPFIGLQYIDLSTDDYSDSLGFRHEGGSADIWNMPVGVSYKYETTKGGWTYAPTVTLGYRFAFGDDTLDETLRYNRMGSTIGTEIAEDSFFTRIGLTAKKDNFGFGIHYGYEKGSNTEANGWGIDCSLYF